MNERQGFVYFLMNQRNTVIYVGVTSDLIKRVFEHKGKFVKGFTNQYNVDKLVYFEAYDTIEEAIIREKKIKGGSREKKLKLIRDMNPEFRDLYEDLEP